MESVPVIRPRANVLIIALILVAGVAFTAPAAAGEGSKPMIWPATGRVSQPYGCTGFFMEPRYGNCRHFHGGIDIADSRGTPIRAAADGVVSHVGWDKWGTRNWMVILKHGDGLVTWYAHLRDKELAGIRRGVRVRQGEVIGYMSDTGHATGVHLHWAVLKDGRYANPRNYVDGNPYKPKKSGTPTGGASACDEVWIALAPGAATAVVQAGEVGGGDSDVECAAA